MSLTELAGHLAYALIAFAFLVRDLFWLRCLSVSGSLAAIIYNYYAPAQPLWLVIAWNSAFALVNIVQIVLMLREKSQVHFTDEERDLHKTLFQDFSPVEFMKLTRLGVWREVGEGEKLTTEGAPVESLMLIYSGHVEVRVGSKFVALLRDGKFIGEMSFVSGGNASATTVATSPTRLLVWPKPELRGLLNRNPTLRFAFQAVLSTDLSKKLQRESMVDG